ncbi:antibiotic biosynthesis monooxygenase [Frankia sp. CNm7]|uniref:Antibiotic biosynthesis monooxygenase n=1 Tax=Frankia nepalensis TaxID=1836974 RepID=A0A937RNK9_9ACTN|nr:antibiotic biosynthesis monooxygenase family protein [Frankia nepalensis]MBL7499709.1 antibiotic biosynthesis monooxygenase [Frankia nepalensis]MBL7514999.1 antibiotic biosynthesis monooxygenase [Frankia nepalensis]MBL7521982.1 antibiotic biosynthesis monooxygenase [Frankia nepalensis]MBL7629141.1 antibiotic biosynthesis monooxygenase [Frankia nepalensis]
MATVTYINSFEVPPGRDEDFLALWTEVNAYMRKQPGYLSHRLHRSLGSDARYRYVNVVQWESVDRWQDAHGEEFRAIVTRPGQHVFASLPGMYEVVNDGQAA